MLKKSLAHLRGQWMGALALFLVLTTGTAYALTGSNTVFSDDIVNGEVKSQDVATDAISPRQIQNDSVRGIDLRDNGVGSVDLHDNGVWSADVRDDTLPDGGLSAADLQAGSVGSSELQQGSVDRNAIASSSVDSNAVYDGSLTGDDIYEPSLATVPSAALGGYGIFSHVAGTPNGCNPESQTYVDCGFSRMDLPQPTRVLVIATVRAEAESGGGGTGYCRLVTNKGGSLGYTDTFMSQGENTTLVAMVVTRTARDEDYGVECNEFNSGIRYVNTNVTLLALSPVGL